MLNQVVLVGRMVEDPKVIELESGKKVSNITIAVSRSYKNINGEYDTDFVKCVLWDGVAKNACEYLNKGDVVGVKGRIQTSSYENENKEKKYVTEVVAEKVTFLSSVKKKENEQEQDNTDDMEV